MDIGQLITDSNLRAVETRWNNRHPEAFHVRSPAAVGGLYGSITSETCLPVASNYLYDDFWSGYLDLYNAATNTGGKWFAQIVGAAPPTVTAVGLAGGWAQCALTAAVQEQAAMLTQCDRRIYQAAYGAQFETRVLPSVLPTLEGEMWWGLASSYVSGPLTAGGPVLQAFFAIDADVGIAGDVVIYANDNITPYAAIATGIRVNNTTPHTYRIDFTNPASVKFYIDGVWVARGTTFNLVGLIVPGFELQPMLGCYKAGADAGLGTLRIDYVRVWQERY